MTDEIKCACGCNLTLERKDKWGRERKYISGHNGRIYDSTPENATKLTKKRWKKRNPEWVKEDKKARYRRLKLKAMKILGNECHFCGVKYDGMNSPIFEFHHEDPSVKEIGISRMLLNKAWSKVLVELEKCVLTCANCHNQHHGGKW